MTHPAPPPSGHTRTEDPVIYMRRDMHHYFVPCGASSRDGTRYVRGDIVDGLLDACKALLDDWHAHGGSAIMKVHAAIARAEGTQP